MTDEEFNKQYPICTPVKYYPLLGSDKYKATHTRSEAWALPCGEVIVLVDGQSSGVSIDHLEIVN